MKTTEDLAARIEQLVANHIAEIRRSASEALVRGFAGTTTSRRKQAASSRATGSKRRDPAQLVDLAERLHAAVCETPGETMAALAGRVGAAARELNRPMNNLRKAGRLRSVGLRSNARYFPIVNRGQSSRS